MSPADASGSDGSSLMNLMVNAEGCGCACENPLWVEQEQFVSGADDGDDQWAAKFPPKLYQPRRVVS